MWGRKLKPDEEEPADVFKRMDDEALHVGLAMKGFVGSEAYVVLMDLLERRRLEVGDRALSDDKRSKEYYQGFRAGACAIEDLLKEMVAQAEDVQETRAFKERAVMDLGLGGGEPVE